MQTQRSRKGFKFKTKLIPWPLYIKLILPQNLIFKPIIHCSSGQMFDLIENKPFEHKFALIIEHLNVANTDSSQHYVLHICNYKHIYWITLAGPTPTNSSRNSEPDILKNGTPASPAVAFASNVFPVPGGPDKIAP